MKEIEFPVFIVKGVGEQEMEQKQCKERNMILIYYLSFRILANCTGLPWRGHSFFIDQARREAVFLHNMPSDKKTPGD